MAERSNLRRLAVVPPSVQAAVAGMLFALAMVVLLQQFAIVQVSGVGLVAAMLVMGALGAGATTFAGRGR